MSTTPYELRTTVLVVLLEQWGRIRRGWDPSKVSTFLRFGKCYQRGKTIFLSLSHTIKANTFPHKGTSLSSQRCKPPVPLLPDRKRQARIRAAQIIEIGLRPLQFIQDESLPLRYSRGAFCVRCDVFSLRTQKKGIASLPHFRDPFPSFPAMNDDEWNVVRRGDRQRKKPEGSRGHEGATSHHDHTGSSERRPKKQTTESALQSMRRKVASITDALRKTAWWEEVAELIRRGQNGQPAYALMCLGIGSFMNTSNARHQLACALLLKDLLNNPTICSVTDPVMDEDDVQLAVGLGFQVIAAEEYELKAAPNRLCTVLFMPHCDFELNEDMLTAAQKFHFEGIVFLANAFSRYVTGPCATTRRRNESLMGHLHLSRTLLEESCPSPKSSTSETAFNDLAVTTLRPQSIHKHA